MTEENAAILGPPPDAEQEEPKDVPIARPAEPSGDITDGDRRDLQEMIELPGWKVFQRIQQKALAEHRADAISRSEQNDPLTRAEVIATRWAYAGIYKAVHAEMNYRVNLELKTLREKQ
jgi:hypothetical protein